MALKVFKKIDFNDLKINKLQDNVNTYLDQLKSPILTGALLTKTLGNDPVDIVIGTTRTLVSHGLQRNYQGFIVVDKTGNANIWRDATYTDNADKYIPLISSTSVTVKLWVF
jgi:hypothetical protein